MADKKKTDKRIILENIIAGVAFLVIAIVFTVSYRVSPKIAIGQFAIGLLAALLLNITLVIKGFFGYFRTFIAIFAFVPMVPFSYISDLLQKKWPEAIPPLQVAIMYFVDMLPLILVTILLLVAVYFKVDRPVATRANFMCILRAVVPVICSFVPDISCVTPVLRQVFGVSMVMTLIFNYKILLEEYPENKWLKYLPLIVLYIRVIYVFAVRSYY